MTLRTSKKTAYSPKKSKKILNRASKPGVGPCNNICWLYNRAQVDNAMEDLSFWIENTIATFVQHLLTNELME